MKKLKYIITIACIAFSAGAFAQNEAKNQLVVALSNPGQPYKLDVGLVTGSIKISVYDGQRIIVDVKPETDKEDRDERKGMHRIGGGDDMDITANENHNSVHVGSNSPNKA